MNTFRIMSRVLVVTVIMFASKTTMAMKAKTKPMEFKLAADLFTKENANLVLNETLAFGGAYKLEELLEKKMNPTMARATAVTAVAVRHGKVAAAVAGLASVVYSGVEEYTPEGIKQLLINILPEKCTSKEAKTAINLALSEGTGVVLSGFIKFDNSSEFGEKDRN